MPDPKQYCKACVHSNKGKDEQPCARCEQEFGPRHPRGGRPTEFAMPDQIRDHEPYIRVRVSAVASYHSVEVDAMGLPICGETRMVEAVLQVSAIEDARQSCVDVVRDIAELTAKQLEPLIEKAIRERMPKGSDDA